MKLKYIIAMLVSITLLLVGCTAHVSTPANISDDITNLQYESCNFLVPKSLYDNATDFVPMTNTHYDTIEDRDLAKATLYTGAIKGQTDKGFMLTSPEYFFYIGKAEGTIDVLNCTRAEVLNLVRFTDITFEQYGRYIANADVQPKANMRVDFRVTAGNGTSRAYAGYIGVLSSNTESYYYIAGYTYSSITEAQLKSCFDLVRSLQ